MIANRFVAGKNQGAAAGLRAVILAGGKGTRLLPFTVNFPKPLVPLGDTPVIEVLINRFIQFNITDITLTVGHLAELVKAYFDRRKCLHEKIHLSYIDEQEPTGTAGSLAMVPDLNQTFLVCNGDLLTDLNFDDLVAFHRQQGAKLTIATQHRQVKVDLGVLELNSDYRLTGYNEKPQTDYFVSMGVYIYEPSVLRYIQPGAYLDFPDLVLKLIASSEKVSAYLNDSLWLDIGRPDDYARAQELYAEKKGLIDRI
jgi:NDP-sugar pyrophosphorylase family protein